VRESRLIGGAANIGGATNVEPKIDGAEKSLHCDVPLHKDDVSAWIKRQKGGLLEVGCHPWSLEMFGVENEDR
jgi:hypothetical protein